MKHLSKLVINPEKVMTDRELVMLKGGYDCGSGWVQYYCVCIYGGVGVHDGPACVPLDVVGQSVPAVNEWVRLAIVSEPPDYCDCLPMM